MQNSGLSAPEHAYTFTKSQVRWTMAGVMLAMLLSALDQTIVGTAMPRIIADLSGFSQYTWVTSIYMITSAVTVPIVGKLSDMYGRKTFYVIGIGIFVAFSLACGFAQNMTQLIIFRGLQGIGGGVMMTNAFTVIADIFPPRERGKYQGLMTAVFSFASVIGPSTGGLLTDNLSWHWVFFINVPLGVFVVLAFIKFFPKFKADSLKHSIDIPGLITLVLTIVPAMLALSWGGVTYAWGSPQIIGMFAFAALMLGLFIFFEMRSPEPIIPLSMMKNRIVAISNLVSFLVGMGMFGSIIFVPLFFQGVLGASATASGNMQIPQSIAVMISGIITGRLMSTPKVHYRILGIISMSLICAGMFTLSRLSPASHYWQVMTGVVITGFGMGISFPVYTLAIQNTVPYSMLGVATSSNTFIRSFGGAVGLAVLGSIMNNRFFSAFINQIPAAVKDAVPMDSIIAMAHNPQALVSPEAQAQLKEMLTQPGLDASVFDQVMDTLHRALASSIAEAFLIGFFILLVGLVLTFFLKVKGHEKEASPVSKQSGGVPPPH
ncbi:MAG: MDR family MFS transporter [Dehalococcoidales bacterium]|jgi:EmrB/QacA subfamily drug resistance transporter